MSSDQIEHAPNSIPVSVITGFLGSGKTTLLSRLLADARMNKAAVIINEFGEVGLDHVLVTSPREDVVLLSSGCLCCSLRGDLVNTLTQLWNERARGEIPAFDRVLVETTGLADPAPVLLTVTADEQLAQVFHVERVITTVDAVHGLGQLDSQPESVKQACVADIIIVTKTDIADADTIAALRARLRRLNPIALARDAVQGEIDPDWLFNFAAPGAARTRDFSGLVEQVESGQHHDQDQDSHDHASHAGIRSFAVVRDEPVTFSGLELWMDMLGEVRGPSLLRIKGIVNVGGRPIVIQAVQHMFHPLSELSQWPDDDRRSRIVFITRDVAREQIERTLDALSLEIAPRAQGIDPEAFRQFVAAASKFR
ncbi:MAG TPA: GTP-binding protein [Pseudolabrys sp.]|nr:GTP-binding protein [Pseudolabrys sp.]